MNKNEALTLETQAHLTIAELRKSEAKLAKTIDERLEKRIQREIETKLSNGSEKLRKLGANIKVPVGNAPDKVNLHQATITSLRDAIAKDAKLAGDAELKKELDELEKEFVGEKSSGAKTTLADALRLNEPIAFSPEFRRDLDAARLYRLSDAVGLGDKNAQILIENLRSVASINDDALAALVKGEKLKPADAKEVALATSFYYLLDERPELVETASKGLRDPRELAKLNRDAWIKIIEESKTKPPRGIAADAYADLLIKKVKRLFPTDALAVRLAQPAKDVSSELRALAPLRKLNKDAPVVGARDFTRLKVDGISAADLKKLKTAYDSARSLVNRYPGMHLAQVLDDNDLTDAKKNTELKRRTALVDDFLASNPDVLDSPLTTDKVAIDKFKFSDTATDKDKPMVLSTVRAYQRVLSVADDIDGADALIGGGFSSAISVATARPAALIERTKLDAPVALRFQERAKEILSKLTGHFGAVLDVVNRHAVSTAVDNITPAALEYLKDIPGFNDFFGSQDFCNCTHCQSILSPAAYFVDLMCFVDENVTQEHFASKPDHPLNLKVRRPDLWSLELTCENTNKPIPYLVIINEILENAVARNSGFVGNFADRSLVGTHVYKQTLPNQVESFVQPFHLPLAEAKAFLKHFERKLADVAEAGNASADALARLYLALPPRDYELITIVNVNVPFLRKVYGFPFNLVGAFVEKFDAQRLLKPLGVTRSELTELIATRYVTANGAVNIIIRGSKRTPASVQNDIEHIENLTAAALDRIHRFVRLWRATGWRIGELDLVLSHLKDARIGSDINVPVVRAVATVHRLQSTRDVPVEELVAMWSLIPRQAILRSAPNDGSATENEGPTPYPKPTSSLARLVVPLFDRLFNQARFVEIGGLYPPAPAVTFLHPALANAAPANVDPNLHRLQAGTGTDDDELYQLIVGLARPLGIDPSSNDENKKRFELSHRNLSLLYRHSRLAKLFRLSVPELFALAALRPGTVLTHVEGLTDFHELLKLHDWWKSTKWMLVELTEIVRPGLAAVITSAGNVGGTPNNAAVTYTVNTDGVATPETVTFAANGALAAVIADWNAKAQHTIAYSSDASGVERPDGLRLSIRAKTGTGANSRLEITGDAQSIFTPAVPLSAVGAVVVPLFTRQDTPSPDQLARELVDQVEQSKALIFADTAFALLPPIPPTATSAAPVANSVGGETITYTPVLDGRAAAAETVTLAANATLDAVVGDWNGKAMFTRAYRANAAGTEAPAGDRLSIVMKDGAGSSTRFTITVDSAAIFAAAPRQYQGSEITEDQSRAIIAANAALLESVDEGHYRLKSGFDPSAAIALAGVDAAWIPAIRSILTAHHSKEILLALLPSRAGVSPERLTPLVAMLGVDLQHSDYHRELRRDVAAPNALANLLPRLARLSTLFAHAAVFDFDNLEFIRAHAALFDIADFDRMDTDSVRHVELFRALATGLLSVVDETPPDLNAILTSFDPVARFGNANQDDLAALLKCDIGLVQSLQSQLTLSAKPFEVLEELVRAIALAQHIGIGGSTIKLLQSTVYDDLANASAGIQTAFRAQFEDEAEWEKKVEPFRDALLSRRRDGLVAFLVHLSGSKFDEPSDLYHYFLLDVELEGCARTSRVASAIDSVQLYVQRCLMNLEETPVGDLNPAHVLPQSIPEEEWTWRKNYRVWEANRRIFLTPESFIEPELRDDKTPLFKTLEEELLSKEISNQAILDAYSRYLRGFDELAHLIIAGSYHEKDVEAKRDSLHLFGVTSDDPPILYYRRVENAHFGVANPERATHWGAWEKLNIQVPVRKVAPVIHNGQLFVFWVRYVTKPHNKVKGGESKFIGYQHRVFVEFSRRKIDGTWTTPQKLRLNEKPFLAGSFPTSYQDDGVILDPIVPKASTEVELFMWEFTTYSNFQPLYDNKTHEVPKETYTLEGFQWDQVYPIGDSGDSDDSEDSEDPADLVLRGINYQMCSPVDLYRLKIGPRIERPDIEEVRVPWFPPGVIGLIDLLSGGELLKFMPERIVWSQKRESRRNLHSAASGVPCFDPYTYTSLLIDDARIEHFRQQLATAPEQWTGPQWSTDVTDHLQSVLIKNKIADVSLDSTLDVVNGSSGDVIIQTSAESLYLQSDVRSDGKYHLRRLTTSLSGKIAESLFNGGLDALLATAKQLGLKEQETDLNPVASKVKDATKTGTVDYQGSMGTYLREIYFHIPFLIANQLNSQGRFEDAQHWYHYIFDPTATETITVPGGLTPEERRRRELDRNWRYREFRNLGADSLRANLTNEAAIEQYKLNPFNPHAIARLRISAYQKAIVMKYIDNLLDWGDDLFAKAFAQLNPEYLREATLKYVTAQGILGDRPAQLGDCGEGKLKPKIFPSIQTAMEDDSEFLIEFESFLLTHNWLELAAKRGGDGLMALEVERGVRATKEIYSKARAGAAAPAGKQFDFNHLTNDRVREFAAKATAADKESAAKMTFADSVLSKGNGVGKKVTTPTLDDDSFKKMKWIPPWGHSFIRQVNPVFCIPGNDRMLRYWDRVEDRLYKLRHCMDIEGTFRLLPLFAPEIDPGLLVGGKAAGISLEDILAASAGSLPPYRFRYLIDKAKAFASIVQSFGAALLAALEKRDAEELGRLRNLHQKNILALTTEVRRNDLKIAEESVEILSRRREAAEYRKGYYADLITSGLSLAEYTQSSAQLLSLAAKSPETALAIAAGIAHLLPEAGSPFAMKYGGRQVAESLWSYAGVSKIVAEIADLTGAFAGMVSGFERREQGWKHQKDLAGHDLKVIEKEAKVAELRRAIATRSLELHEKAQEQHDEVIEFFGDKFSNLELYNYLSRSLQQLHKEAYHNALAIARLAEQAYRFERPSDNSIFVGGEWDASRSGLLAGERLLMALHNMDKRFMETNAREAEINQSFSLAQIDPRALIDLKEVGRSEFAIPEFYFDLFYPGQYRRRIRAVRLTIPCITGPYTNVSAKLTLRQSQIRKDAVLGAANLFDVPPERTASIATSTGQGDAGVFEFSFRDERYMPFEGAGAVSGWRLELPSSFRPFDYQSINDVILNISYTAEEDGVMRQQIETQNAAIEGALLQFLSNNTLTRVLSLRQEFSSAFNRLVELAAGTSVTIDITDRHFPLFLQGRGLAVANAKMVLVVNDRVPVGPIALTVNGTAVAGFADPTNPPVAGNPFGGLPVRPMGGAFAAGLKRQHTIAVNNAGSLAAGGGPGSPLFDAQKLRDILLVLDYHL